MVYKNRNVERYCFNYRFQRQSSKRIPDYHEFSSHSGHTKNGQIYALLQVSRVSPKSSNIPKLERKKFGYKNTQIYPNTTNK